MHTVYIGNRRFDFPSKWEELSGDQLVAIADVVHRKISTRQALAEVLQILLDVRHSWYLRWQFAFVLTEEDKYDMLRGAEWVIETPNLCTEQKLPVIKLDGIFGNRVYGPLKECRGLVFMEFIEADSAYLDFWKAPNEVKRMECLDRLVAILYRPRNPDMPKHVKPGSKPSGGNATKLTKWNGDPRCAFNPAVTDYAIHNVSAISEGEKYAILMFYDACHKRWERNHPHIFKKAGEGESGGGGWAGALMHLAGGSINVDRMMAVNAAAALRDLEDRIIEVENMKMENR